MITMIDALEGLNKWKDRSNEAFTSRDLLARAHKTQPQIEAMCKYFYYLGACNAFAIVNHTDYIDNFDLVQGLGSAIWISGRHEL